MSERALRPDLSAPWAGGGCRPQGLRLVPHGCEPRAPPSETHRSRLRLAGLPCRRPPGPVE
eukprot:13808150-Alexandrium_andersonii.AAC.1